MLNRSGKPTSGKDNQPARRILQAFFNGNHVASRIAFPLLKAALERVRKWDCPSVEGHAPFVCLMKSTAENRKSTTPQTSSAQKRSRNGQVKGA